MLKQLAMLVLIGAAVVPASLHRRIGRQLHCRVIEHLADYDSELRLPNGRVDTDAMVKRLKELGVTTYYWLIWHAATDWDDLKVFLPKASQAGIEVWVYLVPPSESPPKYGTSILRAVSAGLSSLGRGNRTALAPAPQPYGVGD